MGGIKWGASKKGSLFIQIKKEANKPPFFLWNVTSDQDFWAISLATSILKI